MIPRPLLAALRVLWLGLSLAACAASPASEFAREADLSDGSMAAEDPRYASVGQALPGLAAADRTVHGRRTAEVVRTDAAAGRDQLPAERMMVRTAELRIEVPRVDAAVGRCEELTAEHGGYVSRRDGGTVTCRVPAAHFREFVAAVAAMGPVLHEAMQALDVTDQHRDLAIRLDNAKKARERLLALLEQAEKVEDLLKIESELRRLTEEIERMTAELQNLENRVALSTVTVAFQPAATPDRPSPARRRPSRFLWINTVGAEHVLRAF